MTCSTTRVVSLSFIADLWQHLDKLLQKCKKARPLRIIESLTKLHAPDRVDSPAKY